MYGAWTEVASEIVKDFGEPVVLNMLLRKKDGREVTAKRKLDHLKAVNPDGHKSAKDDAKLIREMIVEKSKARGVDNPRMNVSRVVDKAAEIIGMPKPEATGSKGGTTSYDKVAEALRMLRNHLDQTEPGQCLELKDAWAEFEEAAINDGVLKDE
jgi:hypothetical protein